jgi:type II secretory pathway pseudopilin PulG
MTRASDRGFTLVEVLIAMSVLMAAVGTLLEVASASAHASRVAYQLSLASVLAGSRLEALERLPWSGLDLSPPGTLDRDVAGYVDYLDGAGQVVPSGGEAQGDTPYVRRWAITRPAGSGWTDLDDVRVIQVIVLVDARAVRRSPLPAAHAIGTAMVGVRVREVSAGP